MACPLSSPSSLGCCACWRAPDLESSSPNQPPSLGSQGRSHQLRKGDQGGGRPEGVPAGSGSRWSSVDYIRFGGLFERPTGSVLERLALRTARVEEDALLRAMRTAVWGAEIASCCCDSEKTLAALIYLDGIRKHDRRCWLSHESFSELVRFDRDLTHCSQPAQEAVSVSLLSQHLISVDARVSFSA